MKAKFDTKMQIKSDGRKLKACGPLNWDNTDPDGLDATQVIVHATITQGAVVAEGTTHECTSTLSEWMVDIMPAHGQKFHEGDADFNGVLTAIDPQSNQTWKWDGNITLTFDPVEDGS
jgi:hypothetical protein